MVRECRENVKNKKNIINNLKKEYLHIYFRYKCRAKIKYHKPFWCAVFTSNFYLVDCGKWKVGKIYIVVHNEHKIYKKHK